MKPYALLVLSFTTFGALAAGTLESYLKKLEPAHKEADSAYGPGSSAELEIRHRRKIESALALIRNKDYSKEIKTKTEGLLDVWISYKLEVSKNAKLSREHKKPNFDYEKQLVGRLTQFTAAIKVLADEQMNKKFDKDLSDFSEDMYRIATEARSRLDAVLEIKSESEFISLDPERDLKAAMQPLEKPYGGPTKIGTPVQKDSKEDCEMWTRLKVEMPDCQAGAAK